MINSDVVELALRSLKLNGPLDIIPGMTVTLLPHQAVGVSWMLQQENGPLRGGCLADEMGLGKVSISLVTCVSTYSTRSQTVQM